MKDYPLLQNVPFIFALSILLFVSSVWAEPSVPNPAPLILTHSWNEMLTEHPRLFGSHAYLKALATKKPEMYKEIHQGESLLDKGIRHAVEGLEEAQIQPLVAKAMVNVNQGVTDIHQDTHLRLTETALTFDFFYNSITPEDRKKMIEWMNGHLEKYTTDENAFHNSTLSKIQCYLQIAYATWGENPRAGEFRDYALKKLYEGKIVPVLLAFGEGGGYTECGWYTRGSLWNLVQGLEMARRFETYDGFQQASDFFYQRLMYELHQPYPGLGTYNAEHYAVEGDGADTYGSHTEYPRHTRTMLAQYFRGSGNARYIANKRRKGSNALSRLWDFLYEEEPDSPLPLTQVPLAHLAKGIGKVYARSDWSADATWLRFECGDYWNGHQHFETGNFEIFRGSPLATESGEYHDYTSNHAVNWLIRTIAHNSLLVFQPGEVWKDMRDGGRNAYANDGGQAKKWDWTVDTLEQWNQKKSYFERGNIVAYRNTPEFLFTAGDCTASYSPLKMKRWERQIVFLRPHTIVVYDQVESAKPEQEKTWLMHCREEPTIENNTATISLGKGKMTALTILPRDSRIEKVYGYTYDGKTFDPPQSALTPTANKWRMEVKPSVAQTEDVFLHVFFTDQPQTVELNEEDSRYLLKIGESEIRLSKKEIGGELVTNGKTVELKAYVEDTGACLPWGEHP